MKRINFTPKTKEEWLTANKIANRASKLAAKHGISYTIQDAEMDLLAVHLNDVPLRLDELLAADDGNFGHDVFGIRRHINRQTGQLENCFCPRFAQPQKKTEEAQAH